MFTLIFQRHSIECLIILLKKFLHWVFAHLSSNYSHLTSYLDDRTQCVKINTKVLKSQGSIVFWDLHCLPFT